MAICGQRDEHLRLIEQSLNVRILARGTDLTVLGDDAAVQRALLVLDDLQRVWRQRGSLGIDEVQRAVALVQQGESAKLSDLQGDVIQVTARGKPITPRTVGQKAYVEAMRENSIVLCVGPAGTGKTYLAIAMAVAALKAKEVSRLILTRPVVEAGEKLGFLPGDLQDKVDPYLRPLYDALVDILGSEVFQRYMERGVIEVAPLAYMRGRTLQDAFVILDEAQNTTEEQMKMFLTRLGFGSQMVVTGDLTQIDLPSGKRSGLDHARRILDGVEGIAVMYLNERDVVRHELVQRIIRAYELAEKKRRAAQSARAPEDETELVDSANASSWPPVQVS